MVVGLSGKCIVAKRLIRSDAVWDGEYRVGRGTGVLDGSSYRRREGAVLGVNLEHPIVTNRDFATRLFPNYFGQCLYTARPSGLLHAFLVVCCA